MKKVFLAVCMLCVSAFSTLTFASNEEVLTTEVIEAVEVEQAIELATNGTKTDPKDKSKSTTSSKSLLPNSFKILLATNGTKTPPKKPPTTNTSRPIVLPWIITLQSDDSTLSRAA
ncbi:hypothetical protein [Alteromonas sp. KUL49]|uniref:hypothetical protein n=1 Tax=Alteromonas sp. KUL49 TaxID=2480798 RepID=UPI00102EFB2C|nr:hypothetical protein [Alteromonas sp. KUL49]TAP38744.1 hypothetical protein EYS00_15185 [Alteromonas sp. KUL49]GEA12699.1 hypothetical protein KUL49_30740 [Alteromonas sp. KUL49]